MGMLCRNCSQYTHCSPWLCGPWPPLQFCPGSLTEKEALEAAVMTWPAGVRPIVHWSESQEGRKPHAHSDYVHGPIFLHGMEAKVDVQIEAKCKVGCCLLHRACNLGAPLPPHLVLPPPCPPMSRSKHFWRIAVACHSPSQPRLGRSHQLARRSDAALKTLKPL